MNFKALKFSILLLILIPVLTACDPDSNLPYVEPSDHLAIDSLVANKHSAGLWEEVSITAYTRGENIEFQWTANHGSMIGVDSSSVVYWGCPSCTGLNTIQCIAKNEFGSVQDTIMIFVTDEE